MKPGIDPARSFSITFVDSYPVSCRKTNGLNSMTPTGTSGKIQCRFRSPGFTDGLKYAMVAGAVAGGGLTIIANAPNPAGQSILKKHFDVAVSSKSLLRAALIPTLIIWLCLAGL